MRAQTQKTVQQFVDSATCGGNSEPSDARVQHQLRKRSIHASVKRTLAQKLRPTFKVKVQQPLRLVTCSTKTFAVSPNEHQSRLPARCTQYSTINSDELAWGEQPMDVGKRMTLLGCNKGSVVVGCVRNGWSRHDTPRTGGGI